MFWNQLNYDIRTETVTFVATLEMNHQSPLRRTIMRPSQERREYHQVSAALILSCQIYSLVWRYKASFRALVYKQERTFAVGNLYDRGIVL